jgi:hypothetical protein
MSGEDGDVVTEYFRSLILSEIRTGFVSSLSLITNGGHGHATLGAKSRYSLCTLYAIGVLPSMQPSNKPQLVPVAALHLPSSRSSQTFTFLENLE